MPERMPELRFCGYKSNGLVPVYRGSPKSALPSEERRISAQRKVLFDLYRAADEEVLDRVAPSLTALNEQLEGVPGHIEPVFGPDHASRARVEGERDKLIEDVQRSHEFNLRFNQIAALFFKS